MPWTIIWRLPDGSYLVENVIGPQGLMEAAEHFSAESKVSQPQRAVVAVIAGTHEVYLGNGKDK